MSGILCVESLTVVINQEANLTIKILIWCLPSLGDRSILKKCPLPVTMIKMGIISIPYAIKVVIHGKIEVVSAVYAPAI